MMLKCFYILIHIAVFKLCLCHRRVAIGNESLSGKKYLVYFVKSPYSKADDDSWLCAGALVSPTQILTAAACLVEIERIYAIAGYKKYVHGRDIDNDACTKIMKQKVVKISVPKEYKLSVNKPVGWLNVDIGVATVEKPYNFSDQTYRVHCSYEPQPIIISFEKSNELEKTRALALGWGGRSTRPSESAPQYIKSQSLREATTLIVEKKNCARLAISTELRKLIDKYLLCADIKLDANIEVCPHGRRYDTAENSCVSDDYDFRRRSTNNENDEQDDRGNDRIKSKINNNNLRRTSSYEFCQNDHGGPLVSWVGSQEMIIGVALDSVPNPSYECVGPHFYVSTAETANIIKCLLEVTATTRKFCNDRIDNRYQVNEIDIKWPEDTNNTSSSQLNSPKRSVYHRQGNEEQPLHVRPTKDLGSKQDEPETPQQYRKPDDQVYEPQMNQPRAQPYYQPQEQAQEQLNNQFRGQPQGQTLREQTQQQQYDQAYEHQFEQPREEALLNSYKQPQEESYRQPQVDSYNQPQVESYNQPQMESYNQPQAESYNQPQAESYNQPQAESYNQPQLDPYNQPQVGSYSQPRIEPHNQPPMESYNQPLIGSHNQPQGQMYNPPQVDAYKQIQIESYNSPQGDTFNQPQKESYKQHQVESYNQPLRESPKSSQTDLYKQSQPKSYNQPHVESYSKPQVESYNKQQIESHKQPQVQPYNQPPPEPYKQPQPETQAYDNPQIESFKQPPAESYNPLEILSDNQPEEDSFKDPIVDSYKPPPVEPYKQPTPGSYMPQPFKPAPVEPYEQPHLHQLDQSQHNGQPFEKHLVQPFDQHQMQPFEQQPQQSPAQPYDVQGPNVLRERPRTPAIDPPHVEAQSFEQMYSQLHSLGVESPPPPVSAAPEQTFEEMYKNLHDPTLDIPHDQEFEARDQAQEPHFDQRFEQRFEQPFEQQFDQAFDRNPKPLKEPERIETQPSEKQDEVKVRPQVPLDYQDYL